MSKHLTLLFLLLQSFVSNAALAQAPAGLSCEDPGSSLLWQLQGAELDNKGMTLHLFGSIHVGKSDFYPLHPRIEQLFRTADNLVFEVDPLSAASPQTAMQMQLRGMLPAGQTLADILSPAVLARLRSHTEKLGVALDRMMNFKPWMLTLLLANVQANALGYDAANGLESYFIRERAPQSRILELESIDQQLDMLDSLDPAIFLDYSLEEFDQGSTQMDALVQAWQCADKEALSEQLFAALAAEAQASADQQVMVDQLSQRLFTDRNRVMAEGIENFVQADNGSGSWFVVVGSAHLLGEGSVVELLQERGYRVTPLRLE
jgi:uncharacterized protein